MPHRSALHTRLQRQTTELHEIVETQLDLLGPDLSMNRYRQVLRMFYGFHDPVEVELERVHAAVPAPALPLQRRAGLLARDLVALGASPDDIEALPRCTDLPRLSRVEHLAGCLYVLEGASLGGQVIARALRRRLGVQRHSGAAFFTGAGEHTAARWRRVLTWLDEVARAGARSDEMVASAQATFAALARWIMARQESSGGRWARARSRRSGDLRP